MDLAKTTTLLPHRPVTLRASQPVRIVGSINELCLQIRPPDSLNFRTHRWEWGIRRSDGVLVTVGAAMLHTDSSSDTISSGGTSMSADHDCLTIGPSIHDSLHPPFVAVRITATDSLTVSGITWSSWTGL